MKFGKLLLDSMVSEFAQGYIDYAALKHLLKCDEGSLSHGSNDLTSDQHPVAAQWFCTADSQGSIRHCSGRRDSEAGVSSGRCDCQDIRFMVELNRQIVRLNTFVATKVAEDVTPCRMDDFREFVEINAIAIQKACKKFRKRCGSNKELEAILANLKQEPFMSFLGLSVSVPPSFETSTVTPESIETNSEGIVMPSDVFPSCDEPLSPTASCSSEMSHIARWNSQAETLIIFDWDDTLFPTAALGDLLDNPSAMHDETLTQLQQFSKCLMAVLQHAACVGHSVIVTLASAEWFSKTVSSCVPDWEDMLSKLGIKVFYARKYLVNPQARLQPVKRMCSWEDETTQEEYLTKGKMRAMTSALKEFYGARSWKNIVCIGDSYLEKNAITELGMRRKQNDRSGKAKRFRIKVVKFQDTPTVDTLVAEVQALQSLLYQIAQYDDDLLLDMSSIEDLLFDPLDLDIPFHDLAGDLWEIAETADDALGQGSRPGV
eukprot:TRINITY_DN5989_c0_g1_i1.p1 TRINITY_DN5989_c0_g1~~TRINITY_DN5989_c0_g1_i1.p1  ORF type:complete len:488 (+),score=89.51 TRINITY_DN5989_c0_g1_i1:64-1527(+)